MIIEKLSCDERFTSLVDSYVQTHVIGKSEVVPIPTGNGLFDAASGGGVYEGDLFCIAGPAGCGKSSLARSIVLSCARGGLPVLFLSLEEGDTAAQKLLALEAGIFVEDVSWKADSATILKVLEASNSLKKLPISFLHIDEVTIAMIDDEVDGLAGLCDEFLVVIDSAEMIAEANSSRLAGLKGICIDRHVPMVVTTSYAEEGELDQKTGPTDEVLRMAPCEDGRVEFRLVKSRRQNTFSVPTMRAEFDYRRLEFNAFQE